MAEQVSHILPPYEVGGPYPSVSVIVCIDSGSTHPDNAYPPCYEPVAILDQKTEGEPNAVALATAKFIVLACNNHDRLLAACKTLVRLSHEAWGLLDADMDMKCLKRLKAMAGYLKGYRQDIDDVHAAITAAQAGASSTDGSTSSDAPGEA